MAGIETATMVWSSAPRKIASISAISTLRMAGLGASGGFGWGTEKPAGSELTARFEAVGNARQCKSVAGYSIASYGNRRSFSPWIFLNVSPTHTSGEVFSWGMRTHFSLAGLSTEGEN